jgi:hypothetical protein
MCHGIVCSLCCYFHIEAIKQLYIIAVLYWAFVQNKHLLCQYVQRKKIVSVLTKLDCIGELL